MVKTEVEYGVDFIVIGGEDISGIEKLVTVTEEVKGFVVAVGVGVDLIVIVVVVIVVVVVEGLQTGVRSAPDLTD